MKDGIAKLVLALLVVALIALIVLGIEQSSAHEPDEVYPMANQHITWLHEKNP